MKPPIGIYVINRGDLSTDWFRVAQPVIATSMDHDWQYWSTVKALSPATQIFGRHYEEQAQQPFDNPVQDAKNWFARAIVEVTRMHGIYAGWMGPNECNPGSADDAKKLNDYNVELALLFHSVGEKYAAYSLGTGHPTDPTWWSLMLPGILASDYLALHEYSAPDMWNMQPWLCLRFLSAPQVKPIVILECGIDGGPIGAAQQGWKKFGDIQHCLQSAQWYANQIALHPNVIGAAWFAAAWNIGGGSYDIGAEQLFEAFVAGTPSLGDTAVAAALAHKPWMPVNPGAALYQFAKRNGLADAQTDEYPFMFGGNSSYVGQVYQNGIVFCLRDHWDQCQWVSKPPGS